MQNVKTRRLVETGVMLAIGTILSVIRLFALPFGGSVTVVSMLPIVLIAYRYGTKWGLFSGFVFGLLNMVTGFSTVKAFFMPDEGYGLIKAVLIILIDYIIAYTVLGFGGVFAKKFKNGSVSLCLGSIVALSLRFVAHFVSGFIFFGSYAEWFFSQDSIKGFGETVMNSLSGTGLAAFYSLFYNATYMIPEILITAVVAFIIGSVPVISKRQV